MLRRLSLALLTTWLCIGAGSERAQESPPLLAGFAAVDITPQRSLRLAGSYYERRGKGRRDPLFAKAMVLRQGETAVAVVCCDLIAIDASLTRDVRARVRAECGIPGAHVILAATHTHTGPLYGDLQRFFGHDPDAAPDKITEYTAKYESRLRDQIIAAVRQADAAAQPVRVRHGAAPLEGIAFNRRFYMKDGTVRSSPNPQSEEKVCPAGPVDAEVGLLQFLDEADVPKSFFTVFALHVNTMHGTKYSADFPAFLQRSLRERFGGDLISFFGAGTCGDINHIGTLSPGDQASGPSPSRIGNALADAVVRVESALTSLEAPALAVAHTILHAPERSHTRKELVDAKKLIARQARGKSPAVVQARRVLFLAETPGRTVPLEIQVLRLSRDVAVVFLPGEVFVDLGLSIKRASPFKTTLIVTLSNSYPSYIPTAKAFAEGGYEVMSARIQAGWGEQMAEAARRLLYQLQYAP